ncbi:MAG: hypothetical protein ACRCVV_10265 [Shewanella sp.]
MKLREFFILFCGSAMLFGLFPTLMDKTGKEFEIALYLFGFFTLCLFLTCCTYYVEWLIKKDNEKRLRKDSKDHNGNLDTLNDFCNKN